jgi:hypothetical protein
MMILIQILVKDNTINVYKIILILKIKKQTALFRIIITKINIFHLHGQSRFLPITYKYQMIILKKNIIQKKYKLNSKYSIFKKNILKNNIGPFWNFSNYFK